LENLRNRAYAKKVAPDIETKIRETFRNFAPEDLEAEVRRANTLYKAGKPTGVSDALFDEMIARLNEIKPDSPALRLGTVGLSAPKVTHKPPMLSLRTVT